MRRAEPAASNDPPIFAASALGLVRAPSCGERPGVKLRARQDLIRVLEGYASRLRNRSRQGAQERRSTIQVPPQQHGIVFMHGVVAVLHEHPAPIAELHPDHYGSARTQPIYVFAAALRRRRRTAVARDDLALFKMDVDGMVPAKPALQGPFFAGGESRLRGNPAEVRLQRASATEGAAAAVVVGGNTPGSPTLAIA